MLDGGDVYADTDNDTGSQTESASSESASPLGMADATKVVSGKSDEK